MAYTPLFYDNINLINGTYQPSPVKNRNNPEMVANNLLEIKANTRSVNQGMGTEVITQKVQEATDAYHGAILDAYSRDNDALGMEQYMKSHGEEMSGTQQAIYKEKTAGQVDEQWVLSNAIAYSNSGKPLEQQLKEIDKITGKDAKLITSLRESVKNRYNEKIFIKDQAQKDLAESLWKKLIKDPTTEIPYGSLKESDWSAMKKYKETAKSGFAQTTDYEVWADIGSKTNKELQGMSASEVMAYRPGLSKTDFDKIFTNWMDIQNGKVDPNSFLSDVQTDTGLVTSTMAKINKTSNSKGDKKLKAQLLESFTRDLNKFQADTNRKATPEEKQKMIDRLLIRGKMSVPGLDKNVYAFEDVEGTNFYIKDVPKDDRERIIRDLKARGKDTTEDNIRRWYIIGLGYEYK